MNSNVKVICFLWGCLLLPGGGSSYNGGISSIARGGNRNMGGNSNDEGGSTSAGSSSEEMQVTPTPTPTPSPTPTPTPKPVVCDDVLVDGGDAMNQTLQLIPPASTIVDVTLIDESVPPTPPESNCRFGRNLYWEDDGTFHINLCQGTLQICYIME